MAATIVVLNVIIGIFVGIRIMPDLSWTDLGLLCAFYLGGFFLGDYVDDKEYLRWRRR